jgi:transposase InsO family protein
LAVAIDLYSRRVVGWALADHMRTELVSEALGQALESTTKKPGRIFHSDRGSPYGSRAFRDLLAQAGIRQSMSARANLYHNARKESMIGTLKRELVEDGVFENECEARTELFAYLDSYDNTKRRHSSLGYQKPVEYEKRALTLHSEEGELDVGARGGRAPLVLAN